MVRFPIAAPTEEPVALPATVPTPSATESREDDELFHAVLGMPVRRRWAPMALAALLHATALAALVLLPLFWPEPDLVTDLDPFRVLIYDPPPPPPPPLPKGSLFGGRPAPPRAPPAPAPAPTPVPAVPREDSLTVPLPPAPVDEQLGLREEAAGSPTGSESGVPEGMEEGVPGGVVGGIPGGVVGGVIGGTGTGPVPVPMREVDRPPRLLRQVKPVYPAEAFVKKVEGTVVLELVVDAQGYVARVRVVQSIPLLDEAAKDAVRQWLFAPALKGGRPVATIALAPVSFRIF